jgi:hypothetical protein
MRVTEACNLNILRKERGAHRGNLSETSTWEGQPADSCFETRESGLPVATRPKFTAEAG